MIKKKRLLLLTIPTVFLLAAGLIAPPAANARPALRPRPALNASPAPAGLPDQILIQFRSSPEITYESEISITLPFWGRFVIRQAGFAVSGMNTVTKLNKELKIKTIRKLGTLGKINHMALVQLPDGADILQALARYRGDRNVAVAQPNYIYASLWEPDDPYFARTADKDYQWNLRAINMPQAWQIDPRGGAADVKVAVIDSGVAFEDYLNFIKASELADVSFASPQKFLGQDEQCHPLGVQVVDEHPNDDVGHGTHVAAAIAQATNNFSHSAGIAFNVTLIPIKAGNKCGLLTSDIISGINWAVQSGADVINMSFGGPSDDPLQRAAIADAVGAGITVVAAAGNNADRHSSPGREHLGDPPVMYPAAYPEVIAVGATRFDNIRAEYSQYGETIAGAAKPDLVAPGGQLWTDADGQDACAEAAETDEELISCYLQDQNNDKLPDGIVQQTLSVVDPNVFDSPPDPTRFTEIGETLTYGKKCIAEDGIGFWISSACGDYNGTSMAAPHVAAAAALILSVNPNLTPSEIKSILTSTAQTTVIPGYNSNEYGAGLLDAAAALREALGEENGSTLTVCPEAGDGCDYVGSTGIQQAVDAGGDGDTVLVKNGDYIDVKVEIGLNGHPEKHNLTITGESREQTILRGQANGDVITIAGASTGMVLSSLKITAGLFGISLFDSGQAEITNNTITENEYDGIYLTGSSQAEITNNTITDNGGIGIYIYDSGQAEITNNTITENESNGIYLIDSGQAEITNNTIYANRYAGINIYSCGDDHNPAVTAKNNIIASTLKNAEGTYGFGIGGACLHDAGKLDNDVITYDLLWANEGDHTDCAGSEFCDGTGFIYQDPLLANPDAGDFHLQTGSPACTGGENGTYMGAFACEGPPAATPTPAEWTTEDNRLLIGDTNGDNMISVEDYAAVAAKYTDFSVIVPEGTPEDVNNDQRITIDDIALTLLHWTDFEVHGDD